MGMQSRDNPWWLRTPATSGDTASLQLIPKTMKGPASLPGPIRIAPSF
jgi:hypothetical protein